MGLSCLPSFWIRRNPSNPQWGLNGFREAQCVHSWKEGILLARPPIVDASLNDRADRIIAVLAEVTLAR